MPTEYLVDNQLVPVILTDDTGAFNLTDFIGDEPVVTGSEVLLGQACL